MSLRGRFFAATYDRSDEEGREGRSDRHASGSSCPGRGPRCSRSAAAPAPTWRTTARRVESLTITEPEVPDAQAPGAPRPQPRRPPTLVLRAPAEDLPFEDDTFDTVVSTLVLCGVDDQPRALREIRRVLRPGGRLLFLEHVRSDDPKVAGKQDRMNWLNRFVVCCDCNRPTLDTISRRGFAVSSLEHTTLPKAPSFVRPAIVGTAAIHSRDRPRLA